MKTGYRIENMTLVSCEAEQADILLYAQPSEQEKADILGFGDLDPSDLDSVYDPDEVPRLVSLDHTLFIIWKQPDNVSRGTTIEFEVSSLGILLTNEKLLLILPRGSFSLTGKEFKRVGSIRDCLLRVLLFSIHHYQGHLKAIKLISQEIEAKLVTSMENRYLLQMFALGESLTYYLNAIETNHGVLGKLRATAERLKWTSEELELLDEILIENQQAGKQAGIYTNVLSGLMDARGTVINNNMNVLLKNLTIINVVFLPLNLIASMFGMSEYTTFAQGQHGAGLWIAYGLFATAMAALGWVTWLWLTRIMDRQHQGPPRPHPRR